MWPAPFFILVEYVARAAIQALIRERRGVLGGLYVDKERALGQRRDEVSLSSERLCPCGTVHRPGTRTCIEIKRRCPEARVRRAWNRMPLSS